MSLENKIDLLKLTLKNLVDQMTSFDSLCLISFATTVTVDFKLNYMTDDNKVSQLFKIYIYVQKIAHRVIDAIEENGSTNLNDAITEGIEVLSGIKR